MMNTVCVILLFASQIGADTGDAFLPKVNPVFSSRNNSMPIVLWWTDSLFPHFNGDSDVINCNRGSCLATKDKKKLKNPMTRGIIFYGTDFRGDEAPLPRLAHHEWALLHEESPMNNYILSHKPMIQQFNHTATFRRESDFPLTSLPIRSLDHLTVRKPVPLETKNRLKDTENLAPVLYVQSHCNVASDRDRYVRELMKYIKIDSYGECLNNKELPDELKDTLTMHRQDFLNLISRYKFHLAFENAICDDYMTEKLFRPLHVGSVPIYWGSHKARDWMPNDKSIIMMEDFESPQKLAEFITSLDQDDKEYSEYLKFKEDGITNQFLIDHMTKRSWHDDEVGKDDFISSFECHVCDKVNERLKAEAKQAEDPASPPPTPHFGAYNHMGCPAPDVSYGDRSDVSISEDFYMWPEDFWSSFEQAHALQLMIRVGETDSSKLFDYIKEMSKKRRH